MSESAVIPSPPKRYTPAEYFALEKDSEQRHEYIDGLIIPMATETFTHSVIVANVIAGLHAATRGTPCRPLSPNMQLRYGTRRRYGYGDTAVVCGPPQFEEIDPNQITLMNPTLIAEVLSDSTEKFNRGDKFTYYREIDSFREYVLIAQHTPRIETYFKHPDGAWRFASFAGLDARVPLASIGAELLAREVYADVVFPPEPPDEA